MAVAFLFAEASANVSPGLREVNLAPIAEIVEKEIHDGKIPGAVALIGNQDKIVYRRAFGYRALKPEKLPMTEDTIFDLASLTKVIATSTAVMQLVEKGKLRLEDPIATYWPDFKAKGKERITVRELLTHYSGLRPDLDLKANWSGYDTALKLIVAEKPVLPPGTGFLYSDINFEILGELVQRISGLPPDIYCARHIFTPLGMKDTGFKPSPAQQARIAPTEYRHGKMQVGIVHDPTAYRMGGVAGHAGLFSTADDLAIFAQMLLDGGSANGVQLLSSLTVEKMSTPQSPPHKMRLRGLGWDIDAPFAANRGELSPLGAYGHTGFTGTSLWIDPVSQTYVIVLTNRVHPDGKGDVRPLRTHIAKVVAASLGPLSADQILASRPALTDYDELMKGHGKDVTNGKVESGTDVLAAEQFAPLAGLRVGLITNHTGRDSAGHRTLDLLYKAPGVKLAALFSPEHGLYGNVDEKVTSGMEPITALPVYSLYGNVTRPTAEMLAGLDALVFDIQDAGVRFYTYITTMAYAMEAAAKKGIAFYVLDRPNPLNGSVVQGPILDQDLKSFAGYFPLPIRHGMTVGELAAMFNVEKKIGAKLHVITMRSYRRSDWYDETGLQWVGPSPNLHTLRAATLYPGVAMVEGANVSVGRGTDTPFELLGAPWIDGKALAAYLYTRKIQGVRFVPRDFTPTGDHYEHRLCHGVRVVLVDRQVLDAAALGVEIASALYRLYPQHFQLDNTLGLIGARWVVQAIKAGQDPRSIVLHWQAALDEFRKLRAKYLLYSTQHLE
ncbi:MAG: DUF1343 domain-containing protein [Deltaproteobacteria bacterium]|nr:DUF1343 domain-containing protein [Deltaproteobacteria bacterium]